MEEGFLLSYLPTFAAGREVLQCVALHSGRPGARVIACLLALLYLRRLDRVWGGVDTTLQ
jgi:hypothetical protein